MVYKISGKTSVEVVCYFDLPLYNIGSARLASL